MHKKESFDQVIDEIEYAESPTIVNKFIDFRDSDTETPEKSCFPSQVRPKRASAYFSLQEPVQSSPSKTTRYREPNNEFQDTAVFDSPIKKNKKHPIVNSVESYKVNGDDFSYREILKYYINSDKNSRKNAVRVKSRSYQTDSINQLIKTHCESEANKANIFKPKLISSINKCTTWRKKDLKIKLTKSTLKHRNTLTDICYCEGKLWTVSLDYTLKSWDPQSLEELSSIRAHKRGITSVSSYKGYVLTGCKDGSIKYWKDQAAFTIQAHNSLSCLSTLSDSILSGGENIKVWEGLQLVHEYTDYVAFSLLPLFSHTFISGGKNKLSLFDTRTDSEVSDFLSVGPFVSCSKWDDFSFWSLSDIGLIVFFI